jgi:hypothetical protein
MKFMNIWFFVMGAALALIGTFSPVCAEGKQIVKPVNVDLDLTVTSASDRSVLMAAPAGPVARAAMSDLENNLTPSESASESVESVPGNSPAKPGFEPASEATSGVQWKSLMRQSLFYLGVMHAFRLGTEAGTRDGLHNSVVGGYFKALGAMHGWSDGDGYYENYLGHPIEGAVSGYIWVHNDSRYRVVQFGAQRDYWMSRLRAYAFAWAFSAQFEVGPLSEASIGQIQRYCCAYGFVDHVITPNGGLVWMLAGDALDRYVTVPFENRTHNPVLRAVVRMGLNPPQTFANFMMFQFPWHRENRATISKYDGEMYLRPSRALREAVSADGNTGGYNAVPKFEVAASVPNFYRMGGVTCTGGGGIASFRATDVRQWSLEVSGCTLGNSLAEKWSGDSLTFSVGPQWIIQTGGRWTPHVHVRIGGQKITEERVDTTREKQVLSWLSPGEKKNKYRDLYTQTWETTGFSIAVGGGLDFALNRALALRVANIDYTRSWLGNLNGRNFDQGFRISTGLVLRVGTW